MPQKTLEGELSRITFICMYSTGALYHRKRNECHLAIATTKNGDEIKRRNPEKAKRGTLFHFSRDDHVTSPPIGRPYPSSPTVPPERKMGAGYATERGRKGRSSGTSINFPDSAASEREPPYGGTGRRWGGARERTARHRPGHPTATSRRRQPDYGRTSLGRKGDNGGTHRATP